MAEQKNNRGRLRQNHDEEATPSDKEIARQHRQDSRIPRPLLIGVCVLILAALAVAGWLIMSRRPQRPTQQEQPTTTSPSEQKETSSGNVDTSIEPETVTTVEPIDEGGTTQKDSSSDKQQPTAEEQAAKQEELRKKEREERKAMIANQSPGKAIDENTEQDYSAYGALNIEQMESTIKKFAQEWFNMANDGNWDGHSPALRALMAQDYVKEHRSEFEVNQLWECLSNTLYINTGSKFYTGLADFRIVNSIPSPLAYAAITLSYESRSGGQVQTGTEIVRVAVNRQYQICEFYPSY